MVTPRTSKSLITIPSTSSINNTLINTSSNNNSNNNHNNNIGAVSCNNKNNKHSKEFLCNNNNSNNNNIDDTSASSTPTPTLHAYPRQQHEVFIGNLKAEESTIDLITSLQGLFSSVGVSVALFQFILCHRKGNNARKYAFVLLSNEKEEELVCTLHETEGLDFVIKGLLLIVTKRKSLYHRDTKKSRVTFDGRRYIECRPSKSETSVSEIVCSHAMAPEIHSGSYDRKVLHYGQNLPSEDRVTEYKRGSGNYLKNMLISHVRKYVCAFLNSEGGRLLIGVDNECKVCGISCTRKQEDMIRCQIDNTIKHFQPHVLPTMYMVDFIPVKLSLQDNIELKTVDPLLKVLEVSVNKQSLVNCLYETDQEKVYIRRDGSVEGPLRTSQIVEWCRVNFTKILSDDDWVSELCPACCSSDSSNEKRNNSETENTSHKDDNAPPPTSKQPAINQQQFLLRFKETILSGQQHLVSTLERLQKQIIEKDELLLQELRSSKRQTPTHVGKPAFFYCNIL